MEAVALFFPVLASWTGGIALWTSGVYMFLLVTQLGKTKESDTVIVASTAVIIGAILKYSTSVNLDHLAWGLYGTSFGICVLLALHAMENQTISMKATDVAK